MDGLNSPWNSGTGADVWIVGDRGLAPSVAAAEACGLRVSRTMSIADAAASLSGRGAVSLILVEIGDAFSDDTAAVLDALDAQAVDNRTAAIVSCSPATLDAAAARLAAPYAALLCDPSPADRVFAICASLPGTSGVAETSRANDVHQLLHLTDEVARIARAIAGLSERESAPAVVSDRLTGYRAGPPRGGPDPITSAEIRTVIRWRRRRDALFATDLFADPAWDMILDLAAARLENVEVAVSSLCIAAAVPPTTALRWIKTLTDAGDFRRVADPNDRRRIHIRLSDEVAAAVLGYLADAKAAGMLLS